MTIHPGTTHKRPLILGSLVAAASLGLLAFPALAQAVPGPTGSTQANVVVASAISLTGLTDAFTLTGVPGDSVSTGTLGQSDDVSMLVTTNNATGYSVTVTSATSTLVGSITGAGAESIPIGALKVTSSPASSASLDSVAPVTVHSQGGRSAAGGDTITNHFSLTIPFVQSDTYSATLNYVAATL